LHSEDYRERYADNLTKQLSRIPLMKRATDFWAFVEAGRALGDLHVNYESAEPDHVTIKEGDLRLANIADPISYFRVEKMKFAGKRGATGVQDLKPSICKGLRQGNAVGLRGGAIVGHGAAA
jgi:predicted helicase